MDLVAGLKELNLNGYEAQVYIALLELGVGTPLNIANKTGLKRPTVYLILESLRRKRLAGLTFHGKKKGYVAESPGQLFRLHEEQERTLKAVVPYLRGLAQHGQTIPQVRMYDDQKEIVDLFQTIWEFPDRCYISQYSEFATLYDDLLAEYFKTRVERGYPADRAIVSAHPKNIALASKHHTRQYQIRILPKDLAFDTDFSIWGNNVGVYSLEGRYLFVINDGAISRAFRTLFELAWKASSPPKTLAKK